MDTVATVSVLLAVLVLGVIVSRLFTASHDDRLATLPSGRPRRWRPWPRHRTEK